MPDPWYADGLRFACTQCGRCCTVEGYVWVGPEEIEQLAAHLGLEVEEFARRYLRRVGRRLSLVEKPNYECVFWQAGRGCTVYAARPVQCRTFPFWKEHVTTPAAWREVGEFSPGVDQGRRYSVAEIARLLAGKAAAGGDGEGAPATGTSRRR
jgi:hypothetical protein